MIQDLTLQFLIDSAMIDAFADYDMFELFNTRVVAVVDGFRAAIELPRADGLFSLKTVLNDAVCRVEAVGSRIGYALVYAREKERELIFLLAINDTEKGICAMQLKRDTGIHYVISCQLLTCALMLTARSLTPSNGVGPGVK